MSPALFNAVPAIEVLVNCDIQPSFKQVHVGEFLGIKHTDTSIEGLYKQEMCARNEFDLTPRTTGGWSGPKDQQNKTCFPICLWCSSRHHQKSKRTWKRAQRMDHDRHHSERSEQ